MSITTLEAFASRLGGHLARFATVRVKSFHCGRNGAQHYGPSHVTIYATRRDGKEFEWLLIADDYFYGPRGLAKVFDGRYSLLDVRHFIFNQMNLSHVTRYGGHPVKIERS